jgi:dihydropteroate synthase
MAPSGLYASGVFRWESVLARPRGVVMGIVNVTPDSFSDGGRWLHHEAAIRHGLALVEEGADLLDVGGESTRPGAEPVPMDEELRRVLPVVEALAADAGVPVSIDTTKAAVAAAAIDAGAAIVNDVDAGRHDAHMLPTVAEAGAGYIAMHMLGTPRTMQQDPRYDDVVQEVSEFLLDRLGAARDAGIADASLAADPGIGFGKTLHHNLELLARLPGIASRVGVPLVVGTSRKGFIGALLGGAPVDEREEGTLATVVWSLDRGASIVRVHEVRAAARAARFLATLRSVTPEGLAA